MNMKTTVSLILTAATLTFVSRTIADVPAGTGFAYQGRLKQSGVLITGRADFQFKLFNALSGGTQVGITQTILADPNPAINTIDKGLFNMALDFGATSFNGNARWLEIAVRMPPGSGSYVPVSPRQGLNPAPYSIFAENGGGTWTQNGATIYYNAGTVGIGTNNPSANATLHVVGPDNDGTSSPLRVTAFPYAVSMLLGSDEIDVIGGQGTLWLNSNGTSDKVAIGNINPTEKLHCQGNIKSNGCVIASNLTCPSDLRLKKDIAPLTDALAIIGKLRGVEFNWRVDAFPDRNLDPNPQVGFIAQEVREVLPELVTQGGDGYFGVDYGRVTPVLVEAVKELHAQVQEKDAHIAAQDAKIDALTARLEAIEARQNQQNLENQRAADKR